MRLYSFAFHFVLSLFLLGLAGIAAVSRQPLNLRMLPFSPDNVLGGVFLFGFVGLVCTLMALTRALRFLFPLWAAAAAFLLIRGFFFSAYTFAGADALRGALWLILGAIAAFFGAAWTLKVRRHPFRIWAI